MAKRSRSTRFPDRRPPRREPYDRILIVIEGSKTELYYFQLLIDKLKLSTANIEVDPDSGSAPQSVVRHAKQQYKQSLRSGDGFDRVYCVFDKDQHPGYQDAINAVKTAQPANVFYVAPSVPCFEYWLLLHFEYTTKPYAQRGQRSPADCVKDDLRQYLPAYDKSDLHTFEEVMPHVDTAIEHARRANSAAKRNDTDNPSTGVNLLVEYLQNLKHT
ncbi:MAG: RloB domain-containing protein [Caldilineaceae bacterium]|nr:RloB domain-containing protein [Caldilineaceae bacterium]MCB0124197.1 RloB domain-containing protein [Caldilineaceae bacterium]